jgi:tRNA threonylcarbamoyladenosine biosynthesis protein TsaB
MVESDSLILTLDTATSCSTIALTSGTIRDGEVLASITLGTVTHSRKILTTIDWLFTETGTGWTDLSGLAVGLGPGSFTGLRIGMSTAKGLAATAGLPLLGLSSLDGIAAGIISEKRICAVLDARKKEVYAAFYQPDENKIPRRDGQVFAVSPEELLCDLDEELILVGDGVGVYKEVWQAVNTDLLTFAPAHLCNPSAASLGLLAGEHLLKNVTLDLDSVAPLYVRASDAELSLVTRKS